MGFSSAPGEANCTSCHGGLAVNSGPATRTLTFNGSAASSYVPGQTYNLSLTVTRATRNKYGFQLKVEDGQGGDAGTLISTTNRTWLQQGYLNQSGSGNTSTSSGTITWNFQWTAPAAGTGPVTFYFSSNAANNNGSTSGDEIYTDA
ncbi:MAG: choice-of-anchor V domain-containing protein, partial [Bacteroidota bacterium]